MTKLYKWSNDRVINQYNMAVFERFGDTPQPPHGHEFYEIELYLSGNGTANINGKEYLIKPNTLCFLTPTDFHSFSPDPGERLYFITFVFTQNCVDLSILDNFIMHCHCYFNEISSDTSEKITSLTRLLTLACSSDHVMTDKYVRFLTSCILIDLIHCLSEDNYNCSGFQPFPLPVQKAVFYIRSNFKKPITLKEIADFVGFTPNHLSKEICSYLGMSFKEYLNTLRLEYARQQLLLSDDSITDIAYACGFNSLSHFMHLFREKYHNSPLQFRKSVNKQDHPNG